MSRTWGLSSRIGRRLIVGFSFAVTLLLILAIWPAPTQPTFPETFGPLPEGTVAAQPSTTVTTTTTTSTVPPYDGWVDPSSSGQPWGTAVEGLLTFRGNPTRTYYGKGPVPNDPEVVWRFPDSPMCSQSSVGQEAITWCGSGWTGQPAVFERDGRTWVAVGAYSRNVHFLDMADGQRLLPDFRTEDIIKGSVTIDPDGYPLLYTGSRDNYYRVIAIDRDEPLELWALHANDVSPTKWNNDWDGAGLILDDYLFIGGENSQFHIVKLNRGYDADGRVTVAPQLVFNTPGWDDDLVNAVGGNVSIENSVAISGNTVYFANSGGLIQGWDLSGLAEGIAPTRVFRYWAGDDVDASLVIDDEGMLYAGVEYERGNARSREVGQIIKLDPTKPAEQARIWGVDERPRLDSGVWATPAIYRDVLIVPTDTGDVLGLDRFSGEELWRLDLPGPTWSSPVVVDDVLVQGDCSGVLRGFDVADVRVKPTQLWAVELGGCIESTPALWKGRIVVGTRAGYIYAVGDRPTSN